MIISATATAPMILGIDWMDPNWLLQHYGGLFFWISLLIIFVECGLLFPILPGDTLLFAVGLFIATDKINVSLPVALVALTIAAFLGNVAGYELGRVLGKPLAQRDGRIIKKKYFDETHDFFERHGVKALVIGRFFAVVRTFVTAVAGMSGMDRQKFLKWSAIGAVLWVFSIVLIGYFLGAAFPALGRNIDKAMIVILAFSVIPIAYEWRRKKQASAK